MILAAKAKNDIFDDTGLTGKCPGSGMPTQVNAMDMTRGRGLRPRPPVVSIKLKYMGMVLAYSCLALEAQIFQAYPYSLGNLAP